MVFFSFTQFVVLENLSIVDLALSEVKGLKVRVLLYDLSDLLSNHTHSTEESCSVT